MTAPPTSRLDRLTVLAIALLAYAIANVLHEGVGHGGACVAVGGRPVGLNAIYFDCDKTGLGPGAQKVIAAAGSLINVVTGAIGALILRTATRLTPHARYFLWLLTTLSFLQATGYLLFSGLGAIGDWAKVIDGWAPHWAWRAGLTTLGLAGYSLSIHFALRWLHALLGRGNERLAAAKLLTLPPYLAGGVLYIAAGLLNPLSMHLVLISAAAASFGGTSALSWMANLLGNEQKFPEPDSPPLTLERSPTWIAAGLLAALVFVVILGRTVDLG